MELGRVFTADLKQRWAERTDIINPD
jgi:hypothetical protein